MIRNKRKCVRMRLRPKLLLPILIMAILLTGCSNKKTDQVEEDTNTSSEQNKDQHNRKGYEETAADSRNVHLNKDLKLNDSDKSEDNIDDSTNAIEADKDAARAYYYKNLADEIFGGEE